MDGFYKSTYEEDGKKYVLVSTQFEEVATRRAFPCFDEPSFKATFDVSISHSTDYTVLANTIIKDEGVGDDGLTLTQFETTPKMSTYLVAFVVSKFEARGESPGKDYIFKVYSRPEATKFMTVPTTYGTTLIDLLSSWTGINYVDLGNRQAYQVAIPDFAAGAMENWGLITFRHSAEVDLLDEAEKTSHSAKQRIITVVAHELSHQWFGDYVTLDWWSDTWLNEGFATYFEFHIPSETLPSSVPLSVEQSKINTPREDSSKFDDISYDKGGSIVRMMRYILGEQSIKDGLREYLHSNHHSNTNPSQLLSSLNQVAGGLDFVKFMENWIYQAGINCASVGRCDIIAYVNPSSADDVSFKLPNSTCNSDYISKQNFTLDNSAFSNISDTGVLHVDILKGVLIWDWACKLGQEDCINYAITTFEEYKNTNSYLSETIATNSSIRKQDASYVFRAVYSNNDVGVDVALTFLENNLQKITETYKGMSALSNLINGIADRVKTEDQINRVS
ncbi:hypothetical protein NQ314_006142 [Rhamnusium bicolor]|uniref:Uncharacterized protein n=1 Tax=Rhamnusium bicolor TaxID=1586634 RepID=A0AAV8Z6Q6_9CUCU|nr:hypothetical protein NQ314_006142 [Rhamnusium bicolor]